MIEWTLEKYKEAETVTNIQNNQQNKEKIIIIDNIIEELDKKREIAITKKKRALLKDEGWKYGEEEDTIDYIIFIIHEATSKVY